jgi:hypothetical protein
MANKTALSVSKMHFSMFNRDVVLSACEVVAHICQLKEEAESRRGSPPDTGCDNFR